jgi:hypothetical protein
MTKIITLTLMFGCAAALIIWDVVAATNKIAGDTISELSLGFFQKYPMGAMGVALALGIILGHLAWPQYPKDPTKKA